MKVLHITHNLLCGTDTLSLGVYEPIAIRVLWGKRRPPFGGGVKPGGLLWYLVTILHIKYNLFAATETLSLSLYLSPFTSQSQCIFMFGTAPPNMGERLNVRGRAWYTMKAQYNGHNSSIENVTLSRFV
jgi:hypothetical protein